MYAMSSLCLWVLLGCPVLGFILYNFLTTCFSIDLQAALHFLLVDAFLLELIKRWYLRWHPLLGIQMTYIIHINETFSTLISFPVIYGVQPWNLIMVMLQRLTDGFRLLASTSWDSPKYQYYKRLKAGLSYVLLSLWSVDISLHFSNTARRFFILWLRYFTLHETIEI